MKITNLFSGLALIICAFSFVIPSADAAGEVVTVKHSKAKFAGKPACASKYPAGKGQGAAFRHLLTKSCYSCPSGYKRTIFPLKANNACERIVKTKAFWKKATFKGKLFKSEPKGAFLDPRDKGEYWSYPTGYGRAVVYPVNHSSKAYKKSIPGKSYAARVKSRGGFGCRAGAFQNGLENA
jgi:hypothetical protein